MYNYGFSSTPSNNTVQNVPASIGTNWGRVRTVILEGPEETIGSIQYSPLLSPTVIETALPFNSTVKILPLAGEIVEIIKAPDVGIENNEGSINKYYRAGLNIWNQSNNNAFPDKLSELYNEEVPDPESTKTLYPFPGDLILEGREGQSIRMGNRISSQNNFSTPDNDKLPFILIRNGQDSSTDSPFNTEDINSDGSSLYFLSDHRVNLVQSNLRRNSYLNKPVEADSYKGNQVVINSDRIFLNSKKESVLLSANESIGLNAKNVNIDADKYVGIDSDFIYLGEEAIKSEERQPAVLGLENKVLMQDIIDMLNSLTSQLSLLPANPAVAITLLKATGAELSVYIPELYKQLELINSKKVFIDSGKNSLAKHPSSL
jgi:hypothetical protein